MTPMRRNNMGLRMSRELRTSTRLQMSPAQGTSTKVPELKGSATFPKQNEPGESADTSTPTARQQRVEQRRKGMKGQASSAKDIH